MGLPYMTFRMVLDFWTRLFPIREICVGDSDTDTVSRLVDTFKVSLV